MEEVWAVNLSVVFGGSATYICFGGLLPINLAARLKIFGKVIYSHLAVCRIGWVFSTLNCV